MISTEFGFLFPSLKRNIDYFCLPSYNSYHLPYELLIDLPARLVNSR